METIEYSPNRVNLKAGMISGFIASAISGLVLGGTTALALVPEFNFITIQGSIFGITQNLAAAWLIYFLIGTFIWGNLYAAAQGRLPNEHPVGKGLIFGIFIWLIIMIIAMPIADAGFFIRKYGPVAVGIVLITDLVFGMILGYFYNILNRRINY